MEFLFYIFLYFGLFPILSSVVAGIVLCLSVKNIDDRRKRRKIYIWCHLSSIAIIALGFSILIFAPPDTVLAGAEFVPALTALQVAAFAPIWTITVVIVQIIRKATDIKSELIAVNVEPNKRR